MNEHTHLCFFCDGPVPCALPDCAEGDDAMCETQECRKRRGDGLPGEMSRIPTAEEQERLSVFAPEGAC